MTFRQWLYHFGSWLRFVLNIPIPRDDIHMWTNLVGSREMTCLVCGLKRIDTEISEEELERDREMAKEYDALSEKYFREERNENV